MPFIQIIEATTSRIGEVESLMDEWVTRTEGKRKTQRAVLSEDRERPNTFVQIVEFPSYEEAMANSSLPETSEFAEKLAKLCDAPPSFRNLDVRRMDDLSS
jgi:quinol monooxygenase YgiN